MKSNGRSNINRMTTTTVVTNKKSLVNFSSIYFFFLFLKFSLSFSSAHFTLARSISPLLLLLQWISS